MKLDILIKTTIKITFLIILSICLVSGTISAKSRGDVKPSLEFNKDGTFKIIQFADIQDGSNTDPRTIDLMKNILDLEKPDLVVLTGDNIDGKCKSLKEVKIAINNIAMPMEKRQIPWAVVFGNHDDEHGKMSKEDMMRYYMSYPYNISQIGPWDVNGVGNYNIPVKGFKSEKDVFNVYMLDSGKYAPNFIGGYDWIKMSQINWYRKVSSELRQKNKNIVPSLMFFHIPLLEWNTVWESRKAAGERNMNESPSKINSGLFSALIEMGDVKGVFVGHDHINDYVGELWGIKLGYSRNVGYATYGKDGFARGARVFLINESDPADFKTWMRLETDFKK